MDDIIDLASDEDCEVSVIESSDVEIINEVSVVNARKRKLSSLENVADCSTINQRSIAKKGIYSPSKKRKSQDGQKTKSLNKLSRRRPLLKLALKNKTTPNRMVVKKENLSLKTNNKRLSINSTNAKKVINSVKKSRKSISTNNQKDDDIEIIFEWDPAKVIAERQGVEQWQANGIVEMLNNENTLPFIARYRKERTGNINVEKLREIENSYNQLKTVQEKVKKIFKSQTIVKLPQERKLSLMKATTMEEIEHLTAAYKRSAKKTYAERARNLGLEETALEILEDSTNKYFDKTHIRHLVNSSKDGLKSMEEVTLGLQHIIADFVSKNADVLTFVKDLIRKCNPKMECSHKKISAKDKADGKAPSLQAVEKYKNYFKSSMLIWNVRPHQVLAINRGEKQNVLTVKIDIPTPAMRKFYQFCFDYWRVIKSHPVPFRVELVVKSVEDCWERLIKPFLQRHVRSHLNETAEFASIEVFAANLKKLLLTPPVRGKSILAIDPGFTNGCKIGVTNIQGDVLLTNTIYPFRYKNGGNFGGNFKSDPSARTLKDIICQFKCEYVAIGNGTACREMEQYLSNLIKIGFFSPMNVQYTIVSECGASQYSVSPEAIAEFPSMDPNLISAVSLARRVQDPLLEYVKVNPMHLGVGMYQHDMPEKTLISSLNSVVTECVSFVGLDVNVASEIMLRKLSGLSSTLATRIVEYRRENGPFINREQLKNVKGLGPRKFEQCAGFIKIMPKTLQSQLLKSPKGKFCGLSQDPLDKTVIHPESYQFAVKFMNLAKVNPQDIGSDSFCKKVCSFVRQSSLSSLAEECGSSFETMQLIVEALSQPSDYDIRAQFEKPLFRSRIRSIDDLFVGSRVSGTVRNQTHFGSFVDIGVGRDGLIHVSNMNGLKAELGSIVEVSVNLVDKQRQRIELSLVKVL